MPLVFFRRHTRSNICCLCSTSTTSAGDQLSRTVAQLPVGLFEGQTESYNTGHWLYSTRKWVLIIESKPRHHLGTELHWSVNPKPDEVSPSTFWTCFILFWVVQDEGGQRGVIISPPWTGHQSIKGQLTVASDVHVWWCLSTNKTPKRDQSRKILHLRTKFHKFWIVTVRHSWFNQSRNKEAACLLWVSA